MQPTGLISMNTNQWCNKWGVVGAEIGKGSLLSVGSYTLPFWKCESLQQQQMQNLSLGGLLVGKVAKAAAKKVVMKSLGFQQQQMQNLDATTEAMEILDIVNKLKDANASAKEIYDKLKDTIGLQQQQMQNLESTRT